MSFGIWQVVLILLIVLIIFGAGKLPKVMGDVGRGVKSFRSGLKEATEEEQQEASEARKIEEAPTTAAPASPTADRATAPAATPGATEEERARRAG